MLRTIQNWSKLCRKAVESHSKIFKVLDEGNNNSVSYDTNYGFTIHHTIIRTKTQF